MKSWRADLISWVIIISVVALLAWPLVAGGQETFSPVDGLYQRSESAGAITYSPFSGELYQRTGDRPGPNPPTPGPQPPPESERAKRLAAIVQRINDRANAINLTQLIEPIRARWDSFADKTDVIQLVDIVLVQGLPSTARAVWKPFTDAWTVDKFELRQARQPWLLDDMLSALRTLSTGSAEEDEALVLAASDALGWAQVQWARNVIGGHDELMEVVAQFPQAKGRAINFQFVLRIIICILQNTGEEFSFLNVLQCILEGLG